MQDGSAPQVVVISGASSGIGRATALAFARRGAAVVVAARREQLLREVAAECERAGGRALAVPTDVTDEAAVQRLADRAVEAFGHVDVWVNNAAVADYARFEDLPPDEFRRVVDVNLFGYVHGTRAILPHFRARGRGVLIQNVSVLGRAVGPYYSAYGAAKYGVRGFSEALRQELRNTGIEVCMVFPSAMDTPLFEHAANHTGRVVRAPPPAYPPEKVAEAMVSLARNPRREVILGGAGKLQAFSHAVAPNAYDRMASAYIEYGHFRNDPAEDTSGNLYEPVEQGAGVRGGWRKPRPPAGLVVAAVAGVSSLLAWRWTRRRSPAASTRPTGGAQAQGEAGAATGTNA